MALPVRRSSSPASPVAQWDPARELEDLQDRMGQLMQTAFPDSVFGDGALWAPPVDIEETEDAWVVEAELPGVKREDVNVELNDSELVISGEIKERERKGILRRRTRRVGQFEFRVVLPGDTDPEGVEASIHDGVLTVRIPKPERSRRRQIEIQER